MTRWARAGNTQKHKKMPGDATPWEELSCQVKRNLSGKFTKNKKHSSSGLEKLQNESLDKNKVLDLSTKALDLSTSNLNFSEPSTSHLKKIEYSIDNESTDISMPSILSKKNIEKQGKFLRLSKTKRLKNEYQNEEINSVKNKRISKKIVTENSCDESSVLHKCEKEIFSPKVPYKANQVSSFSNVSLSPDVQSKEKKVKKKFLREKMKKQKFANQHQEAEDLQIQGNKFSSKTKRSSNESQEIIQNYSGMQELDLTVSVQQKKKSKAWKKNKKKQFQDVESLMKEKQYFNQKHSTKAFPLEIQNNRNVVSTLSDINFEAQNKGKKTKNKKKLKKQKLANPHQDSKDLELLEKYSRETKQCNTEDEEIYQQNLYDAKELDLANPLQMKKNSKLQKTKQGAEDSGTSSIVREKKYFMQNEATSIRENEGSVESKTNKSKSKRKRKLYLKKLKMKRAENGIILLPSKVERKLYLIKKKLREKGLAPEVLKEIIRKERRKEELKFRKTFSSKVCFNCRKKGHILAECPVPLQNSKPKSGICFKCGSTEHTSFKCTKNVEGFPLAACFVCKEQGHISRDCPQNKHGIYPKGGKCSMCGNVNHLRKDCPSLKRKNAEQTVAAHTLNQSTSVDAEIIENKEGKVFKKKPKIVKF